jgi:hypothetical protein
MSRTRQAEKRSRKKSCKKSALKELIWDGSAGQARKQFLSIRTGPDEIQESLMPWRELTNGCWEQEQNLFSNDS